MLGCAYCWSVICVNVALCGSGYPAELRTINSGVGYIVPYAYIGWMIWLVLSLFGVKTDLISVCLFFLFCIFIYGHGTVASDTRAHLAVNVHVRLSVCLSVCLTIHSVVSYSFNSWQLKLNSHLCILNVRPCKPQVG